MSREISTIGVVGAGTMGAGIAQTAAQSGFNVILLDASEELVTRGLQRITADLDKAVARERIAAADRESALARLVTGIDYATMSDCQIVIEAVPEQLDIKISVLKRIASAVGKSCIIASNTSSLSISTLAAHVAFPERVIGMHFFNPVPRMQLVEVVAGEQTAAEVVDTVSFLAESLGKRPVQVRDHAGFAVNRVLIPMINEAVQALDDGVASPADIDTAMSLGAGHPMGPLALADLIGLDVVLDIMRVLERAFGSKYSPAPLLANKVAAGELGRKSGRGFYSYDGGGR